jgi:hypothetical protein
MAYPGVAVLGKIARTVLLIWLFNVLFVVVHEVGHASIAACCGAKICSINISPYGFDGATSYTTLSNAIKSNIVLAGGMLATAIATVVLYWLRNELAVYVMGLRTVESLANFNQGSDMTSLMLWIGPWSYLASLMVICLILIFLCRTVYENRVKVKTITGFLTGEQQSGY